MDFPKRALVADTSPVPSSHYPVNSRSKHHCGSKHSGRGIDTLFEKLFPKALNPDVPEGNSGAMSGEAQ
ncbi:MAG: hypothetical protein ACO3GO_01940, partial [Terrimicrobiaceae bacterium]